MAGVLIVLQGGSAVGKTTLSRRLAHDLKYVLLTKDNFKEMLYDTLGKPVTREMSSVYGLAATKALYVSAEVFLKEGSNVIIESAFTKELANRDIDKLVELVDVRLLQVYLTASPEVRAKRYHARIANGERHPGHPSSRQDLSVEYFVDDSDRYGRLAIDDTIEINTDVFDDDSYKELLDALRIRIEGK